VYVAHEYDAYAGSTAEYAGAALHALAPTPDPAVKLADVAAPVHAVSVDAYLLSVIVVPPEQLAVT
jgi:hypothetical protein